MKNEKKDGKENNEKENTEKQDIIQITPSSDIADSLATIIVDKIISDAVINSKINDIYKTMNSHCFSFLTNFINPYLKSRFLFYENGIEDLNQKKKKLFFSSKPMEKVNTWSSIPEPKACGVDRCANTKTKLVKYKKYTELKDDGLRESEEDIKQIIKSFKNEKSDNSNIPNKSKKDNKYSVTNSQKNISHINDKENKNNNIKKNEEIKQKKKLKPIINYNENSNSPQKKEKEEVLEISTVDDLPIESYENKYSLINSNEENDKLRKEREFQLIKKEEMKKLEKELQEKRSRQSLLKRMDKAFDSNRLTFDPNGKIINLKFQNYDNLEGGFAFSKLKIKTANAKKKSVLNLMDVIYPIEGVDPNPPNENKNESIANTRRSTLKGKENLLNRIESDISKIKIEKNEEDDKMWKNNKSKNTYKEKKESILPSGANFDKIIPEIGVIIHGENHQQVKEGGFDYVKKYNKPSFNELSRFISDSVNLNTHNYSSLMNSNNSNNDLNQNNSNINNYANNEYLKTEDNNYIGYKEEFNDNNNPLIKNAHYLNNNLKYYSPSSNRYNNLSLNNSGLNSKRRYVLKSYDRVRTENDNDNYQSIQLSKNFDIANSQNLKNIFNEEINNNINNTNNKNVNSIDVDNLQNLNYLEKAVLPFKKLRFRKQNGLRQLIDIGNEDNNEKQIAGQAFMNKFNSQIINNKEWGKDDDDVTKIQEKLNKEMNYGNQQQSLFRKQRNNNRMKNLGIQIMTEGNNKRERKVPLFGGNLK